MVFIPVTKFKLESMPKQYIKLKRDKYCIADNLKREKKRTGILHFLRQNLLHSQQTAERSCYNCVIIQR